MRFEHPSLRQGLIRAWCPSLGASGLTLIDRSGRNAHGTLTGMAGQDNWQASGSGVALNFDGADDYVACGATLTGAFTYSSWFWLRAFGASGKAIHSNTANGNIYLPAIRSTTVIVQGDSSGQRTFTASPSLNQWSHVCVRRQPDNLVSVFINGVELAPTTSPATITAAFTLNSLGRYAGNTTYLWDGYLDDIRIYDRAITLSEVRLLASRRGIGLSPLPDRAAGMPRKLSVNVGGVWRPADAYVHDGTAFRLSEAKINVSGVWK
jgi:hypothetical protein